MRQSTGIGVIGPSKISLWTVGMDPLSGSRGSRDRGDSPQTPVVNALALSSSIPHLDDGCGTGHQRLHELQDLIEQYKVKATHPIADVLRYVACADRGIQAANGQQPDHSRSTSWRTVGGDRQPDGHTEPKPGWLGVTHSFAADPLVTLSCYCSEDVETEVNSLRGQLDKVSSPTSVPAAAHSSRCTLQIADAASEARDLLEQDLIHEEEIRDRQAKSELGQRAEVRSFCHPRQISELLVLVLQKLHQMVTDMRAEIAQMEVASTTQIEFSTENLLNVRAPHWRPSAHRVLLLPDCRQADGSGNDRRTG